MVTRTGLCQAPGVMMVVVSSLGRSSESVTPLTM
jgi:hypothetical protein